MKREILIVEDLLYLQKSLIDWLVQVYPEFEILAADNAEDAIDTAKANQPSLIIIDLNLPRSEGFDTVRRIKAAQPEISILMIMDEDSDMHKDFAFSAGADACLSNYKMQMDLLPVINELLKKQSEIDQKKARFKSINYKEGKRDDEQGNV